MSNPDRPNPLPPIDITGDSDLSSNDLNLTTTKEPIDITGDSDLSSKMKLFTSPGWRETLKLTMSMFLAASLWVTLIVLIGFNYYSVNQLSQKLAALKGDDKDGYIKDAIAANNDTAKGLYAFLTPLAAGITTYYFSLANSSENKNKQE